MSEWDGTIVTLNGAQRPVEGDHQSFATPVLRQTESGWALINDIRGELVALRALLRVVRRGTEGLAPGLIVGNMTGEDIAALSALALCRASVILEMIDEAAEDGSTAS
jgi:hypothetical protein